MSVLPHWQDLPDNSVVGLMAPTASGKTDLACQLYDTGRFELISVDSALIYRDMDIGTAKPSHDELLRYPHYLVDIIDPNDSYSVMNFVEVVRVLIDDIHGRGKLPLLVGGTMMYFMALFDGISPIPETEPSIRKQVAAIKATGGNDALYTYLQVHDPVICQRLKVSDTQRITRAVEVHLQTGRALSQWQTLPKSALSQQTHRQWYAISLMPDRAWLHARIAERLEKMWQAGFVDEVITLIEKYPVTPDMPSMRCVGYRQVIDFLIQSNHPACQHNATLSALADKHQWLITANQHNFTNSIQMTAQSACQAMKNQALYATRQLAKRQYTWLRQLNLMGLPTTDAAGRLSNNVTLVPFHCIKEVEKQLIIR